MRGAALKTLTDIVDALLRIERRSGWARYMVFAAITVWLVISTLALLFATAGFFAWAGAVGVGMVLALFALVSAVRHSYQTLLLKRLVLVMRGEHKGHPPQNELDYDRNLDAVGRLFARLERKSNPARILEVSAAVLATLQWGYGDLLIHKAMICGDWKCE